MSLPKEWKPIAIAPRETTICRPYKFCAAHFIPLGPNHKCSRMHGHGYVAEVRITGTPDERGLVHGVEFFALDAIMEPIITSVDHHCWNDKLEVPTVENIAAYLAELVSGALKVPITVRVYEDGSWAEVFSD